MSSFDDTSEGDDDLVFMGPVSQRELILTWRRRRQLRLERERKAALNANEPHDGNTHEKSEDVGRAEAQLVVEEITPDSGYCNAEQLITQETVDDDGNNENNDPLTSGTDQDSGESKLNSPSSVTSEPIQSAETDLKENRATKPKFVLQPAKLNFEATTLKSDWAKRLNMSKKVVPKRPFYVQPLNLQ